MKVSHAWLQSYFKETIPTPEKLGELFNLHAFEVEGIEKVGADTVLDLKVLPDRAHYALCHRGIAGEVHTILNIPMVISHLPRPLLRKEGGNAISSPKVHIEEKKLCNRYIACRLENVSVKESLPQVKERFDVIGQRAINTIVDATNYVMMDIGQPLHAFDADKVEGDITVRFAEDDEKITLLDSREVSLKNTDLVIADSVGALAIAGVKGGKRAEVTVATKNIIIESANFNSTAVRKTSTRLNLRNESSKRFENEITPGLCMEAMHYVIELIKRSSPETEASEIVDVYPQPATAWTVSVTPEYVSSVIGEVFSAKAIIEILERMNCKVEHKDGELIVTPPLNRLDIKIAEDIADEIGRIHGYANLPSVLPPTLSENVSVAKAFYYAEKVKNILVQKGFTEALLYTLVPKGHFEIAYPLASDKAALRESIIPKLKDSLIMNTRNADLLELNSVKIFEIGKAFPKSGEQLVLALGVSLSRKNKSMTSEMVVKDAIASIEKELSVTIAAKVETEGLMSVTEINFDELIKNLPEPKSVSDIHFTTLPKDKKYIPFSPYPFASRDIAVFVPKEIQESEVSQIIKNNAGPLLLKMRLFDVFTKDDKTSYAFRLIFQSYEKTLEEGEINSAMDAVNKALADKGWTVR